MERDDDGPWVLFEDHERAMVEAMAQAHGQGQESAIRDANAGRIDDLIAERLSQLKYRIELLENVLMEIQERQE